MRGTDVIVQVMFGDSEVWFEGVFVGCNDCSE